MSELTKRLTYLPNKILEDKLGQELIYLTISLKSRFSDFFTALDDFFSNNDFVLSKDAQNKLSEAQIDIARCKINRTEDIIFISKRISQFVYTILYQPVFDEENLLIKDKKLTQETPEMISAIEKIPQIIKKEIAQIISKNNQVFDLSKLKSFIEQIIENNLGDQIFTRFKVSKTNCATPKIKQGDLNDFANKYSLEVRTIIKKVLRNAFQRSNQLFSSEELMDIFDLLVRPQFNNEEFSSAEAMQNLINETGKSEKQINEYVQYMLNLLKKECEEKEIEVIGLEEFEELSSNKTIDGPNGEKLTEKDLDALIGEKWMQIVSKLSEKMKKDTKTKDRSINMNFYLKAVAYLHFMQSKNIKEISESLGEVYSFVRKLSLKLRDEYEAK